VTNDLRTFDVYLADVRIINKSQEIVSSIFLVPILKKDSPFKINLAADGERAHATCHTPLFQGARETGARNTPPHMSKLVCKGCGGAYSRLGKHLSSSARCHEATFGAATSTAEQSSAMSLVTACKADGDAHQVLFASHQAMMVVDDLASLRYDCYMSEANIERVKMFASRWQASSTTYLEEVSHPRFSPSSFCN